MAAIGVQSLSAVVHGRVILPDDAAYDETRRTFNSMLDRRPAVIVEPIDTADVAAAVQWAAAADLPISVRGGGHNVAGHGVGDGSLMIDLAKLRTVTVDPIARVAEAGGGARLEDLDTATTAHGLAAASGTYADTGIGGILLGGGISYLLGTRGFACDGLVGAELVTADGSIVDVDAEREPELLWALRGGGGNFGVVTRFRVALTPLTTVFGGRINFVGPRMRELVELLFETQANGPDELALYGALWRDDAAGGQGCMLFVAWTGDLSRAEALLAPFRSRPDVLSDGLRPMSYLELQTLGERGGRARRDYWKAQFVDAISPPLLDAIDAACADMPEGSLILLEPIYGQAHRVPDDSAAFGARSAAANISAIATWDDAADDPARIKWARDSAARWVPFGLRDAGYLNYESAGESGDRVARAFGPERFARLRAVKRRCDPENRFRFNPNIPPA